MVAKVWAWLRFRRLGIYAGLGGWALLAVASVLYAQRQGQKPLEALVTWDEWAVSVLLLPWFFRGMIGAAKMFTRNARRAQAVSMVAFGLRKQEVDESFDTHDTGEEDTRTVPWIATVSVAAWVVFALDLVVRGLFGLGWQPFV